MPIIHITIKHGTKELIFKKNKGMSPFNKYQVLTAQDWGGDAWKKSKTYL